MNNNTMAIEIPHMKLSHDVHNARDLGGNYADLAKTLGELGYSNVVSMAGGFGRWKDEGRAWKTPVTLTAEDRKSVV